MVRGNNSVGSKVLVAQGAILLGGKASCFLLWWKWRVTAKAVEPII